MDRASSYRGEAEAFARKISQALDKMDFSERRVLLRPLVDNVVYNEGELAINAMIPVVPLHPASRRLG